ncbi:LOG family protein [Govanella unica]|uniref:Cytokinin riboside 5'-monophosphate phosphoribohydrolase n=1 Tax=Govanella unica TaxID=2975056 RepID=A0A9X3Z7S3_9PROT|nr:TIGR00730 family Rossman fold protein [Govania unica]MDA5194492.1 TIGR00730 family Rossman fold protein [Govania unica]
MNPKSPLGAPPSNKSYKDPNFINSPAARPLRIMSEYLGPKTYLEQHNIEDTVVIFGSARLQPRDVAEAGLRNAEAAGEATGIARGQLMVEMSQYYEATRELARRLTEWSLNLEGSSHRFVVCSGGGPGIMEAANRGAREAGGASVGFNISLPFEQSHNPYITEELNFEFHYFFMRKFWFAYLAKAFVVMPGGFGTLDELMEILTLLQTRKMTKVVPIVLFGKQFWNDVINLQALVRYGTISAEDLDLLYVTDSIDEAFSYVTDGLMSYAWDVPGGSL